MNKTLLFLLLPGLLISCKPTPPSGDNGEIVPLTSECLLKNSDLYMKYPYKKDVAKRSCLFRNEKSKHYRSCPV